MAHLPPPPADPDLQRYIAHYTANPPEGSRIPLEFTDDEVAYVERKAAEYGCSVDAFLNAALHVFKDEEERRHGAYEQ